MAFISSMRAWFGHRRRIVGGFIRYKWLEESFTVATSQGNQRPLPASDQFVGYTLDAKHVAWLRVCLLIVMAVLTGRIVYLQGIRGAHFLTAAEENRIRIHAIPAKRGLIYDRSMRPLVTNATSFALNLLPNDLSRQPEERDRIIQSIATLAELPVADIYATLDEYKKYSFEALTIQEGIPLETALRLQIASADMPGVRIEASTERSYVNLFAPVTTSTPNSLAHLIGYVGKLTKNELEEKYDLGYSPSDRIGKTGIESSYEDFLRGTYGRRKTEVDVTGRERLVLAEDTPLPGRHVVLGIDMEWQRVLEQALARALRVSGASRAAAVVLDARTGVIRALVSLPAYDNNEFIHGIPRDSYAALVNNPDQPLFPRAISGTYPSGSTIKPLIAAAALQEGRITPQTTVLSTGGLEVGQWFFPDWKPGGHGATNVIKALAESVNTFFYLIGGGYKNQEGLGVETITKYLRAFGLADALGVDIPGEAAGFLPSPSWKESTKKERWYIGDTYNLSIGQGDVLVTPLQLAHATAIIANGGTAYRPHLVERVIDPITGEVQPIEPQIIGEAPVAPAHLATVRRGMRACVESGSCRALADLSVPVAGKTGTAQWSADKKTHAWFTAFAPVGQPEIAVSIIIEEGGEGSKTAVPVAREFFQYWSRAR
ncbi:MAG: penicillin-binding protein 2 [Patescibacteria group bacterium]